MRSPPLNIEAITRASYVRPLRYLAVMKGVRFGVNHRGDIGLSFGAYVTESAGAPQFLDLAESCKLIAAYDVGSVANLEGKPCWVTITDGKLLYDSPCLM